MEQQIYSGPGSWRRLGPLLEARKIRKLFLVCGRSFERTEIYAYLQELPDIELVRFSGFSSNPKYEEVRAGVELFNGSGCQAILAAGGGSALDTAKCIKLYCCMDPAVNYLEQIPVDTGVPLLALPTTAGTGSESTRFAVIYYEGKKQSITHESILPDAVILEPAVLKDLPVYQKKCTMLDALCQGIESWWSVNSTEESKGYAGAAIRGIVQNGRAYIEENDAAAAGEIQLAANLAGRAINLTQTTAAHAMSYKLTSLYRLPHGHAVAVCLPEVWDYMLAHPERCVDRRGAAYLQGVFKDIAQALGCESPEEAIAWFRGLLDKLEIKSPIGSDREKELRILTESVNPERLKNNPVALDQAALRGLYERIVRI